MALGFDVGTGNLVLAKGSSQEDLTLTSFRDVFLQLDNHNPMIIQNFDKNRVPYVIIEGKLYLLGSVAQEKALVYGKEVRRPLARGIINSKETVSQKILQTILKRLIDGEGPQKLTFSIPSNPIDVPSINTVYHEGIFTSIFEELGFEVSSINEGMAVVYSELLEHELTGVGISMGAGMCNVSISLDGMPIQCNINGQICDGFSIARAGDWVDNGVHEVFSSQGKTLAYIVSVKESKDLDLLDPKDEVEKALQFYYRNLCKYLAVNMAKYMMEAPEVPTFHIPLNVAVAGGTSMPKGVGTILLEELNKVSLPFKLREVIMAKEPLTATAIGCYLAASLN